MNRLYVSICVGLCFGFFSVSAKPLGPHEIGQLVQHMFFDRDGKGLARLEACYDEYGCYDGSSDQSELARSVLVRISDHVATVSKMGEAACGVGACIPDGEFMVQVLNKAYYCSKMLESVEQKFEQVAWPNEVNALIDYAWLHEVLAAICAHDYSAVLILTAGKKPTRVQVRLLLGMCKAIQNKDAVDRQVVRNARIGFMCTVFFLGGIVYSMFQYFERKAEEVLPRWYKLLMSGFLGYAQISFFSFLEGEPTGVPLQYSDAARLRSNAIFQLIVERFLNGTDL